MCFVGFSCASVSCEIRKKLLLTKGCTESKAVLEDLINDLKKNFGELVVTRGKKHTLLGININITEDKMVKIEIKEHLLEAIEAFGENIDEKVTTQ